MHKYSPSPSAVACGSGARLPRSAQLAEGNGQRSAIRPSVLRHTGSCAALLFLPSFQGFPLAHSVLGLLPPSCSEDTAQFQREGAAAAILVPWTP